MRSLNYTSQLSQGAGLIDETITLLSIFEEGMSWKDLLEKARNNDVLSRKTDARLTHIVHEFFYMRFMKRDSNLPLYLIRMRERGLTLRVINEIFMVCCAREHAVFFDFVTKDLNAMKAENKLVLGQYDILNFMRNAVADGKAQWGDSILKKNASYVKATLIDFDMIDKKNNILPYDPSDFTVLFLMYEAHLAGASDMAIWDLEEWQLFNMSKTDVLERIMSLSLKGAYIAQSSGELLNISWSYNSMEELIDAAI